MQQSFQFYTSSLDLHTKVKLNSFIDGLVRDKYGDSKGVTHFKPLEHQDNAIYVMVSSIADLQKIEARGIKHVHSGDDDYDFLMLLLSLKNGQLHYNSLEDDSFLL